MADSYDNVLNRLIALIIRVLNRNVPLSEETALQADVGMTSLQVMELVLEIEEEFDISFPLNRLPDIRSLGELSQEIVTLLDQ
ncbi:MAG: acyl carrier protein [Gammaproteobacteria bacterium]